MALGARASAGYDLDEESGITTTHEETSPMALMVPTQRLSRGEPRARAARLRPETRTEEIMVKREEEEEDAREEVGVGGDAEVGPLSAWFWTSHRTAPDPVYTWERARVISRPV